MKKIYFIFIFFTMVSIGSLFSEDNLTSKETAQALMENLQNGDFESMSTIVQKLKDSAIKKKYKANDTNMLDVLYNLATYGTENQVKATAKSQDFAYIRTQATIALGEIGGDYARKLIIQASTAEKDKKSIAVITSYMISFAKIGDDGQYSVLKQLNYIFDYMPKNDTGDVVGMLREYIQCVDSLTKETPMAIITRFGIMDTLKDLVNEDTKTSKYGIIFSPLVRKPAKALMASILANSI